MTVSACSLPWEVYRCDLAESDQVCGIREVEQPKPAPLPRMIVSDTARDECCHHMRRVDAEHIVSLHNAHVAGGGVVVLGGALPPAQFEDFRRAMDALDEPSRPPIVEHATTHAIAETHVEMLDLAWGIIANVGNHNGSGWGDQHPEWIEAARRWRDRYGDMSTPPLVGADASAVSRPSTIADQPSPVSQPDRVAVWGLVIEDVKRKYENWEFSGDPALCRTIVGDMRERDRLGRERYGVPLTTNNGRNHVVDAYQELLDAAVYIRAEIAEAEEAGRKSYRTVSIRVAYSKILTELIRVRSFLMEET